MGWQGADHGAGEEPTPASPGRPTDTGRPDAADSPRDLPSDSTFPSASSHPSATTHPSASTHPSAGDVSSAAAAQASRDLHLSGFARGGDWDTCPPSAGLAAALQAASGAEWRAPGATHDELLGLLRKWQALESWAAAGKLGLLRALVREDDQPLPGGGYHGDLPDGWTKSLTHDVALALAMPPQSADKLMWTAWDLEARLPRTAALLAEGELTLPKARAVGDALNPLTDADAAQAEALVAPDLPGKTFGQAERLAVQAAITVDPESATRRREEAERNRARIVLRRDPSGAASLSGYDLPTDETLAAHANVCARAAEYKASGAFTGVRMDQFRALAYLDLVNSVTVEARIASGQPSFGLGAPNEYGPDSGSDDPDSAGLRGTDPDPAHPNDQSSDGNEPDGSGPNGNDPGGSGPDGSGPNSNEPDGSGSDSAYPGGADPGGSDPDGSGPDGDGPDGDDPDDDPPDGSPAYPVPQAPPPGPTPAQPPRPADLIIPLSTLLGLAERPGEGHGLGPLDPGLCRSLAATAANSPHTTLCITVTDSDGRPVGHGCARPERRSRRVPSHGSPDPFNPSKPPGPPGPPGPLTSLPAALNLTITAACLTGLAPEAGPGTWSLNRTADPGPPDGFGAWELALPDGGIRTVRLEPVPTFGCDHRHESHAYQPNDTLRHLVQIRDHECTFPTCSRHARESDFEHATPYDKGGLTCACNAGARSRACHRVKQSPGWNVTQPRPGWHQWTTPSGREYTQGPKRYPV